MATAHKKTRPDQQPARPVTRKRTRRDLNQNELLARIDRLIRELEQVRQQLQDIPKPMPSRDLVEELFGAAGHGTRDEYDPHLECQRFGVWQTR